MLVLFRSLRRHGNGSVRSPSLLRPRCTERIFLQVSVGRYHVFRSHIFLCLYNHRRSPDKNAGMCADSILREAENNFAQESDYGSASKAEINFCGIIRIDQKRTASDADTVSRIVQAE